MSLNIFCAVCLASLILPLRADATAATYVHPYAAKTSLILPRLIETAVYNVYCRI